MIATILNWRVNRRGYVVCAIPIPGGGQTILSQHRIVMQSILGRELGPKEDVHHVDGNRSNNDPDNLSVIDHGKHIAESNRKRASNGPKKQVYRTTISFIPDSLTVEIGKADIINIGGSVYLRIPPNLREKPTFKAGKVALHQEPGSDDIIVRSLEDQPNA